MNAEQMLKCQQLIQEAEDWGGAELGNDLRRELVDTMAEIAEIDTAADKLKKMLKHADTQPTS